MTSFLKNSRPIPYDFIFMWNLKRNINEWNGNSCIDTEHGLMAARGKGLGDPVKTIKGLRSPVRLSQNSHGTESTAQGI